MHNIASYVIIPTKKQACDPAEVGPGDVSGRANVLHVCKIQDDRHKADENKVGASDDAQKECSLPKFGTAQDHLKEDLRIKEEEGCECTKIGPPREAKGHCRGCACQAPVVSLEQGRCCLFIALDSTDSRAEENRANIAICPVTFLIRTSQPGSSNRASTFHNLLSPGYIVEGS